MAALRPERPLADALESVAQHFLALPRVQVVVSSRTTPPPPNHLGWTNLGGRAWVRQWPRDGGPVAIVPPPDAGPEAALSLPWISGLARDEVVVLTDVHQLPPEAEQDRRELTGSGVRGVVVSSQFVDGTLLGSLSLGSVDGGPWEDRDIADFRLLHATLTSRMVLERARRSLTDAVSVAEQARNSQQHFFAALGHELRTPVTAITAYAEVLADEADAQVAGAPPPPDIEPSPGRPASSFAAQVGRDSRVILRASEQLLAVVEDLLDTGRMVGDHQAQTDVDVAEAVRDVMHWHRATAEPRDVTVTSTVTAGMTVRARPAAFRQSLTNLVGNAIIHNRTGGAVEITAQPLRGESGDRRVRVAVRDDGPGLARDALATIFEPYVRHASPTVAGTGLGLFIARAATERDGGTIGAESVVGAGSTFWVELPAGRP